MTDSNYYTVSGWMINKLGLSGNDLICFAIIYGFSQNHTSKFEGSFNYMAEFMSCSPKTAQRSIDKLLSRNLIYKLEQGISKQHPSAYRSNVEYDDGKLTYIHGTMDKMTIVKETQYYGQNDNSTMDNLTTVTMDKMTNNINRDIYCDNNEKKDINSSNDSFISKEMDESLSDEKPKKKRFTGINPSKEEIETYIKEKGYHITAESMINYYTDHGRFPVWRMANGNLVKDWKRCCGTFEDKWKERNENQPTYRRANTNDPYREVAKAYDEKARKQQEELHAKGRPSKADHDKLLEQLRESKGRAYQNLS